ncbi:hypothetical protein MNB_SV-15-582 [hydrothermal vent metagenome]|uniref:Sulfatase N-terminal domain-containing protein n=1 Tax=hydrothermal vent metagenome TaxID=652676 RepID=A0A1W1EJ75_9ZZZZ
MKSNYIKYIIYSLSIILLNSYIFINIYNKSTIIIDMQVPHKSSKFSSTIFYDIGYGFNLVEAIKKDTVSDLNGNIVSEYPLDNINKIKGIRFEPPVLYGKVVINSINIKNGFHKQKLDLEKLYKSKNLIVYRDMNLTYSNKKLLFTINGVSPYIQLFENYNNIIDTAVSEIILYIFISSLLLSIILFILYKIEFIRNSINSLYLYIKQLYKLYLASNTFILISKLTIQKKYLSYLSATIFLIISIILMKTFIIFISIFYFHYNMSIYDILFIYTTDILIAILVSLFGVILLLLSSLMKLKIFNEISQHFQFILYFLMLSVVVILLVLGFFYLLSGYIFFQWGAFLEVQNIKALFIHGAKEEFLALFKHIYTYIFIFISIIILYISQKLAYYLDSYRPKKLLITIFTLMMILSSLSYFQLNYIYKSIPSTQSPLLMIFSGIEGIVPSTKIPIDKLIQDINITNFNPLENRKISDKYKSLYAKAKDMNVIFFVMESTRAKNLSCYGYKRDTMPYLNKLLSNSMFFHNAFVNNPRTSKTMASLVLGIYPSILYDDITWNYKKIKDINNSLISKFMDNNYSTYFGTMQDSYTGEYFDMFLNKLSKNRITLEDPRNFKDNRTKNDERLLTDSFLKYTSKLNSKFMAILWSKSAHSPYISEIKKYENRTDKDKYDNCLVNIDNSLKNLVDGLKKENKLDNTLIIIFGDHGEGLDDKMERGHGNFSYNHSIHIPFIIYNPKIFKNKIDMYQRFQIKDIASTTLYLLGLNSKLNQSINIFSKTNHDKIYISNSYHDKKLGFIFDNFKFIYRLEYDISYLFNIKDDPNENINIISTKKDKEIKILKEEVLKWYKYQLKYINKTIY